MSAVRITGRGIPTRSVVTTLLAALTLGVALTACDDRALPPAAAPNDVAAPVDDGRPASRSLVVMPVPISVDPPEGLPVEDRKPGLTTWRAGVDAEDAIRIMTPRVLRSEDGTERPAPGDFHAYLVALERSGARISDDRPITVDGVHGRLFTITSTAMLGTALGCWTDTIDGCFGLPPQLRLRMATFTVEGRPVLLWARTSVAHPSALIFDEFEQMLRTVSFRR